MQRRSFLKSLLGAAASLPLVGLVKQTAVADVVTPVLPPTFPMAHKPLENFS
jgi:hypothetical protein